MSSYLSWHSCPPLRQFPRGYDDSVEGLRRSSRDVSSDLEISARSGLDATPNTSNLGKSRRDRYQLGTGFVSVRCRLIKSICVRQQSVAKLLRHLRQFWNLLDELRTRTKKYAVCQTYLLPLIIVDHSSRHCGYFVSGQHCAGGMGYVGLGYSKIRQNTVKCPNSFATDCRFNIGSWMFDIKSVCVREGSISGRECSVSSRYVRQFSLSAR